MLGDTMTQWVVTADDRSLRYITPPALVSPPKNPESGGAANPQDHGAGWLNGTVTVTESANQWAPAGKSGAPQMP